MLLVVGEEPPCLIPLLHLWCLHIWLGLGLGLCPSALLAVGCVTRFGYLPQILSSSLPVAARLGGCTWLAAPAP